MASIIAGIIEKRILKIHLLCSAGTKSFLFRIGFFREYSFCNKNVLIATKYLEPSIYRLENSQYNGQYRVLTVDAHRETDF